MSRPTVAYVDLSLVKENIAALRKHVGSVKMMTMVKADAYGHGLVQVARAAQNMENGADAFGVATVEEGSALRAAGITLPILCVGACFESSFDAAVRDDITVTLYDTEYLQRAELAAARAGKTLNAHIKIDSGMARLGVQNSQQLNTLLDSLAECRHIKITGAYTHFATSDSFDKSFTREQAALFEELLAVLKARGYNDIIRHAACSGAVLDCPEYYYDMVRPGIAIYGYYPSNEVRRDIVLKPVMRLESRLTQVKTIKKGESVGYGRSFIAQRDTVIGVVPIGYGDGYRRGMSNKGYAIVNGCKAAVTGRVCMDQLMLDITDIEGATEGALVTLIGQQGDVHIWADEIADICDTISYEITLNISKRVPKIYCGE